MEVPKAETTTEDETQSDALDAHHFYSNLEIAHISPFLMEQRETSLRAYAREVADVDRIAGRPLPVSSHVDYVDELSEGDVGDTLFARARHIERAHNLRQVYLKFEGGNPTGTQKDRIAFAHVRDAKQRGFDCITVATCGNYGVATALAASRSGLRCVVYISSQNHTRRISEISALGAEVIPVDGDYEYAVDISRASAKSEGLYDANPGIHNRDLQLQGYAQIAFEIFEELRDAPAVVAVPVSNGTTLAGIYSGFVQLYKRGKTSRIPRMVAGSSYRKNPIVHAFLHGLIYCADLDSSRIHETAINEPLINWHSIDGNPALDALRNTNGWVANVSDQQMFSLSRFLRTQEGLHILPASTAGLHALLDKHHRHNLPNDRYVAVLTGRKT
jgi:threonine synthase